MGRSAALVQELERIELLRRFQALWTYVPALRDPPRWHSQLVDPIQAHNEQAAVTATRAHVRSGLAKELQDYRMHATKRVS